MVGECPAWIGVLAIAKDPLLHVEKATASHTLDPDPPPKQQYVAIQEQHSRIKNNWRLHDLDLCKGITAAFVIALTLLADRVLAVHASGTRVVCGMYNREVLFNARKKFTAS